MQGRSGIHFEDHRSGPADHQVHSADVEAQRLHGLNCYLSSLFARSLCPMHGPSLVQIGSEVPRRILPRPVHVDPADDQDPILRCADDLLLDHVTHPKRLGKVFGAKEPNTSA